MKKLLLMLAISLSMTGVSMADQQKPPERSQARRTSTYIVWTSSRIGIHKSYELGFPRSGLVAITLAL